jgi:hypothetical protein
MIISNGSATYWIFLPLVVAVWCVLRICDFFSARKDRRALAEAMLRDVREETSQFRGRMRGSS